MSKQIINVGSIANDGSGDTLRLAGQKINSNFTELYDSFAAVSEQASVDWEATSGPAKILNKPELATVATSGSYADLSNKPAVFSGNYADLTNKPHLSLAATSGSYNDLINLPVLFGGSYSDLTNRPALFSGSYADLTNTPTIPSTTSQLSNNSGFITSSSLIWSNITGRPTLATVATSGSYADLTNKPTIPNAYSLPTASTSVLGGVKVDGVSVTINGNGIISAPGGGGGVVLPADAIGFLYNNGTGTISWASVPAQVQADWTETNAALASYIQHKPTIPTSLLNLGISDGTTGQVLTTNGSGTFTFSTVATSGSGLQARTTASATTATISNNATANASITGFKTYALLKITTSAACWVRIYTDTASRTADSSRVQGVDPLPGSGVIAEIISTTAQTIIISPGTIGFNNEASPTTAIPVAITNLSGSSAAITTVLTLLQLEA
jgi:hypothetical protein